MAGARPYRPRKNQWDLILESPLQCLPMLRTMVPVLVDSPGGQSQQIPICVYTCKRTKSKVPAPTGRWEELGGGVGHIPWCSAFCSTQAPGRWENTCLHGDSNANLIWKHPPRHTKRWSFICAAVVQSGDAQN